jgi:DNA-binding response OmpR family regulator
VPATDRVFTEGGLDRGGARLKGFFHIDDDRGNRRRIMAIRKVLIVDDSATDLKKLEQIVAGAGYAVITAVSGKEALERVKRDRPDAVLLDIIMNDLNGFQVCRAITSDAASKNTPVVLVSSKRERIDQVWGAEQGAVAYVTKPFTPEQILDQLRAL